MEMDLDTVFTCVSFFVFRRSVLIAACCWDLLFPLLITTPACDAFISLLCCYWLPLIKTTYIGFSLFCVSNSGCNKFVPDSLSMTVSRELSCNGKPGSHSIPPPCCQVPKKSGTSQYLGPLPEPLKQSLTLSPGAGLCFPFPVSDAI